MRPEKPETGEEALLERYRRASSAEGAKPAETTRSAILAEARRVAAAQSSPEVIKPFDTRPPAANRPRWRVAAFGTFGIAVLAALIAVPIYRPSPAPTTAALEHHEPGEPAASGPTRVDTMAPAPRAETPNTGVDLPAAATAPAAAPAAEARASRRRAEAFVQDKSRPRATEELAPGSLNAQVAKRGPPSNPMDAAPRASADATAMLLRAVTQDDLPQVNRLLDQGASPRAADDAGRSVLFLAVMQGRSDLVRLLLARGADPSAADRSGQTPLAWARQQQAEGMVQLLTAPPAPN